MIRLTAAISRVPFPFDASKVVTARLVSDAGAGHDETKIEDYLALERLGASLEVNPAVRGAGFTTVYGLLYPWRSRFRIEGEEYHSQEDAYFAYNEFVSDSYFKALGLNLHKDRSASRLGDPRGVSGWRHQAAARICSPRLRPPVG